MSRYYPPHYLRSEDGQVAIMAALSLFVLIVAMGAAIDMVRAQMLQTKMYYALDSAGLAAGATASAPPVPLPGFCGSSLWAQCEAQKYFNANYPAGYLSSGPITIIATQGGVNNSIITLSATAAQATIFMKIVGIDSINIVANSQITIATSGMELVLVLDNTGSMNAAVNSGNSSTSKIVALQQAATELVNILYGSNTTVPNLWIGLIPFSQAVNVGTSYTGWMNSAYDGGLDFGPTITGTTCQTYTGVSPNVTGAYSNSDTCAYKLSSPATPDFNTNLWGGCVMARSSPYDISDDPPSVSSFQAYHYPSVPDSGETNFNPWETSSSNSSKTTTTYNFSYSSSILDNLGPNALCSQQITQMTANKSTVLSAIASMTAAGDTDLDLGMVWGWRMLSPRWTGIWGGEMAVTSPQLPLPYNTAMMQKVVVFMTDGMDRFIPGDYSGYGFLGDDQLSTTTELTAESTLDSRMLSVCNSMKQNGVIIYTIGFGNASPDSPPTEADRGNDLLVDTQLLQSCATQNYAGDTSHFFLAPTNARLQSAFQQIAGQLANLRVSQ